MELLVTGSRWERSAPTPTSEVANSTTPLHCLAWMGALEKRSCSGGRNWQKQATSVAASRSQEWVRQPWQRL